MARHLKTHGRSINTIFITSKTNRRFSTRLFCSKQLASCCSDIFHDEQDGTNFAGGFMTIQKLLFAAALCFFVVTAATAQSNTGTPDGASQVEEKSPPDANYAYLDKAFRAFNDNYRLGPGDEIAIRVKGQPAYSLEKAKVSPSGTIYHELVGDVTVVGLTMSQVTELLTNDLSEYLKNPQVSVQLIEAASAKVI